MPFTKNIKFSLKFKILSSIAFLLTVCTVFNIGYSYKLFTDDKTSYIYEAGLKKAETLADEINFKINEIESQAEIHEVIVNNSTIDPNKYAQSKNDTIISGIASFENNIAQINRSIPNTKLVNNLFNSKGIKSTQLINELITQINKHPLETKNRTWLFSPVADTKLLFFINENKSNHKISFSIVDLASILETFHKDRSSINRLLSLEDKNDLFKNKEVLQKINFKKSKKGAFTVDIDNSEMLISYVFVTEKILILSEISKNKAFGITSFLVIKTALFAAFLFGIAAVFGIYFSASLTYPISKLTDLAQKIASGNFSNRVKISTTDEISILGDTFNFMSSEISDLLKNKEELILKLEDYNRNLESKVQERTLELKIANDFMALMVNSLDQGLMVFDNELNCHPMFTKACEPMFGVSPLNKTFTDVLSIDNPEAVASLKQWAMVVFKELIPFESAINLGPRNKTFGKDFTDPDYKFIQIDYYPMRNGDEEISNIVMIATDKTSEIQAIERAKEKEAYVTMILKILNNKTQFESFINEVEDIFNQFKNAYSSQENFINFELCMMLFHTLNGGFGIYNLGKLQKLARDYESELMNVKDSSPDAGEYIPFIESHIVSLKSEFHDFKVELDKLIGTKFSTNQSFTEVPREKILALYELILSTNNNELIDNYLDNFVKQPIISFFKAYDELCTTSALKIGKDFEGLTFHNSELMIVAEPFKEFFNVLVHLFRNCIDHGLEDKYTRVNAGKSPNGHIDIRFEEISSDAGKFLEIVIQDDGAGIDPDRVRSKYQQLKPDEDTSNISNKEIIYKIFDPFFSTRDEVSALSGRGVGMSAIKEVADKLNAEIEIESHIGKGTIFSFLIPMN